MEVSKWVLVWQPKLWVAVVAFTLGAVTGFAPYSPAALAADVGYRDFPFSATEVGSPAGEKPQSKLWFNDGAWWGVLFDRSTEEHHIYRYDRGARTWQDTGTLVDERNFSKADTLWDGDHLYVVSAGPRSSLTSHNAHLLRYSYDPGAQRYSLDAGFPSTVTRSGMEAIVLAKDSTGALWVTYTQGSQVYVSRTRGDDLTWTSPFALPVEGANVSPDDISSVVAFGSQIGVMWSNEVDNAFYFATHRDGDPDNAWAVSAVLQGAGIADDHINLKADSSGRVFAAVKTSLDDVPNQDPKAPQNLLLVRDWDGNWTNHLFGTVGQSHTRPIVLIDEENRNLFMFASKIVASGNRSIYYKQTSLDKISLPEGPGMPFIQTSADPSIFDVTSTKQNVNSATGLLVEASDNSSGYYAHNIINDLSTVDTSPPSAQPPEQVVSSNSTIATTKVPTLLSWSATDGQSDVSGYKLQQSTNGGPYENVWLPSVTANSHVRPLEPGNAYRFRVMASDGAGNSSDWAYGPEFNVDTYQETNDRITYNGNWSQQDTVNAYGGARKFAVGTSAETAAFTFTGSEVAWVSTKNFNLGKAEVYLDGVKWTTVDLYSPSGLARQVVFTKAWPTSGTHTIEVRALGTKNASSTGPRVDLDAFVVLRR